MTKISVLLRVDAAGDLLNQQADRVVVIGFLSFRSIHQVNGGAKAPV